MEKYYVVSFAKRAFDDADVHGNVTDSVRFEGENDSVLFRHQPTTSVAAGDKFYGRIESMVAKSGKEYKVFKREKIPEEDFVASKAPGKAFKKDQDSRSDGMRQGMCMNNAAAYVAATMVSQLSPTEWADEVFAYANALYVLGDLGGTTQSQIDDVQSIMAGDL